MGAEFERKFLVTGDGWRSEVIKTAEIGQGYLAVTDRASIRVRISDGSATLTVKSQQMDGIRRIEVEAELVQEDAQQLLSELATGSVEKTRYTLDRAPQTWTIDVFHGLNGGLVLLEVEDVRDFETPVLPDWVGADVTSDSRYLNASLSASPFTSWRS